MDGFDFLGVGKYTSLMVDMQIKDWGKSVIIDCLYHPNKRMPYRIICSNCEKIKWIIDKEEIEDLDYENLLDIIGIEIIKEFSVNKVMCHTHAIDFWIICENIEIEKSW
ncbi:MAG: hypothetical protein AAF383_30170 [Cyanobacteria bacterium P01_A01_bin.83]